VTVPLGEIYKGCLSDCRAAAPGQLQLSHVSPASPLPPT